MTLGQLRSWHGHLPPRSPLRRGDDGAADLVAGRSLTAVWTAVWRSDPSAVALIDVDGRSVTATELDERSLEAARRLVRAGVQPQDRIAISAAASADLVVAYVGALRCGAVVLAMNTRYRQREVAALVADAAPSLAITDEPAIAEALGLAAPQIPVVRPALRGLPTASDTSLGDPAPSDPALLIYTSGTTGTPKGVPLTHANLLASAEAVRLAWRWNPDDRLALALPLFHLHGLGVGLHGSFTAGATAQLLGPFEPSRVLGAVAGGATMFFGVPTMWNRLVSHAEAHVLRSLRLGVSGSAPLSPALHGAVADVAGAPPLERYGMSETAMLVSNPYDGERRAGSVGFPLPGVDVRIASPGPNGAGEIEVRGQNVFAGYWRRPDATCRSFREGWFRTGDLGLIDDGYLRIVGRAKELIISGGYNVYPVEVEDVLRDHPAVADAAVVGVDDDDWGEIVAAAIVWQGQPDPAALQAWCTERLAPYKRPRRWRDVDAIPRNALGKTDRSAVIRSIG